MLTTDIYIKEGRDKQRDIVDYNFNNRINKAIKKKEVMLLKTQ